MSENNNQDTLKGDEAIEQKKQQAKKVANKAKEKTKKILNNKKVKAFIVAHLPLIILIIVIIIIIIIVMGIIMLLMALPGLFLEQLDEFAGNIWGNFSGLFTGDSTTAKVGKKQVLNLAQYLENMGYDIQTYGLGEVTYKDDGKTYNNRNGTTREIEKIGKSVDGKNYLQAYIAADENTYVLAQYNMFGAVKALLENIFDNDKDEGEITESDAKTLGDKSKEYSTGMINVEGYDSSSILGKNDNSGFVSIDRKKKQMIVYTNAIKLHGIVGIISQTFAGTESIKWGNMFRYDLDNWAARYGRPKELFLAIHLSTMMPDLAYKIATKQEFNTKVNLGVEDVKVTFNVEASKDDKTIKSDEIAKLFLNNCLGTGEAKVDSDGNETGNFVKNDKYKEILNNLNDDEKKKFYDQVWEQIESGAIKQFTDFWGINMVRAKHKSTDSDKSKLYEIAEGFVDTFTALGSKIDVADLFSKDSDMYVYLNRSDEKVPGTDWTYNELINLAELEYSGRKGITNVKWPFIRSVTNHWYYDDIDFTKNTYRLAKAATKTIDYVPDKKDDPLKKDNLSVKLNATLESDAGIIYQVCEPEAKGPNENIVKVFRGSYYAYDGSALTAKKIANTKAVKIAEKENKESVEYKYNGEKYTSKSDSNMQIGKTKVNLRKDKANTLAAFSILENMHTEAAEYIYRNLKELVVKLQLFDESELKEDLKQILLWPIKTDYQYTKWDIDRDTGNWGGTIKCNSGENTVVAPSDAIVEKIEGDSITLKFTTINDETAKLYDYIYNKNASKSTSTDSATDTTNAKDTKSDSTDKDSKIDKNSLALTKINKDIVTGMKITIRNVEIDGSITVNSTVQRGQVLGKAKDDQIKITMQALDKSVVEDLSEYFIQQHNTKYEEIMKSQMENKNKKQGIDIGNFGAGLSSAAAGVFPGNSNYAKVYNYLISKGFSRAAACGILGNMVQETTGADPNKYTIENIPDCNPKSERARVIGIYQFTGGNCTRFIDWCNKNSKDKYDPIAQTDFMIECIRGGDWLNDHSGPYYGESGATEAEFEKSKDPETAASDFCAYYERCGGDEKKSRLKTVRRPWAKKFYDGIPTGGFSTGNADTSNWTKKGKVHIPVYKQSGQPWSNVPYGNGKTISSSGCGACALAMGVSGLTGNAITPDAIANITKNSPTYSNSISVPGKLVANTYNLTMESRNIGNGMTNEDFSFIDKALDSGKVLVFSGSYTASGHFIIVYGKEGNNYYAADSGNTTTPDTPYSRNDIIFTKAHYQMIALGRK